MRRLARNTFVVGTCLAGLAGVMIAPLAPVQPFMGLDYILKSFFVLVVGGLGSRLRPADRRRRSIGGVDSVVSALIDRTDGYSTVLVIAILFLWLRPRGHLCAPRSAALLVALLLLLPFALGEYLGLPARPAISCTRSPRSASACAGAGRLPAARAGDVLRARRLPRRALR